MRNRGSLPSPRPLMPTERGDPRRGRPPGLKATGLVRLPCPLLLLSTLIYRFPSFVSIVACGSPV